MPIQVTPHDMLNAHDGGCRSSEPVGSLSYRRHLLRLAHPHVFPQVPPENGRPTARWDANSSERLQN